jgi:hypothetical protein
VQPFKPIATTIGRLDHGMGAWMNRKRRIAKVVALALMIGAGAAAQPLLRTPVLDRPKTLLAHDGGVLATFPSSSTAPRVMDSAGRDITAVKVTTTPKDLTLILKKNEPVLVLPSKPAPPTLLENTKKYLSGNLVAVVDDPTRPGKLALFKGLLFIQIQSKPLAWNEGAKAFHSGLTIGLEATDDSDVTNATFDATTVTLRGEGGATISRGGVPAASVQFTGPAVFTDLGVDVTQPSGVATVFAHQAGQSVEDTADVAQAASGFKLAPATSISGYGLESIEITATRVDQLGQELRGPSIDVTFSGNGAFEPVTAAIPSGESSTKTTLTSRGTGDTAITATAANLKGTTTVHFGFPWTTLLFALGGGTLGGIGRGLRRKVRTRLGWRRVIAEGCFSGVLFTGAVMVGLMSDVGVVAAAVRKEYGVGIIAALAGFVGWAIVDVVTERLAPKAKVPSET